MTKKTTVYKNYWTNFLPLLKMFTQKLGTSLSGMIMPIIGVIIAWGLLTAFFMPSGWTPVGVINEYVVSNVITWLIPILIGFLGGKQVYGLRGGFIGAAATAGIVAGAKMFESGTFWAIQDAQLGSQFLGAMISGPLWAFVFKKLESLWEGKIKTGFEMLVNNFAMGIIGFGAILFSFFITPWAIFGLTSLLELIVDPLTKNNALPVTSIFVEPAKPLFLNNAINHGVFTPLGNIQVEQNGYSPLFYIESNPGPGMGVLLAYMLIDKKQRGSASSASIIHFFGGIHEVYFPFVIMRPILMLPLIFGGATGVALIQIFSAGAISPASPGSVIALFTVSQHSTSAYIGLALAIIGATAVSFAGSVLVMKLSKKKILTKNEAISKFNAAKGSASKYIKAPDSKQKSDKIKLIVFACDAGMGSSAMGAGILRKLVKKAGLDIKVKNAAIRDLESYQPDLIVVQAVLAERAKNKNSAQQFVVENFLENAQYETLVSQILNGSSNTSTPINPQPPLNIGAMINPKNIILNGSETTATDAITTAGNILVKNGYVAPEYIPSMLKRNADVSVYIGNGVAIPHGQSDSKQWIKKSGISLTTYPRGIKWNNNKVYLVVGIAGEGDQHMEILSELAVILAEESRVIALARAKTKKGTKGDFTIRKAIQIGGGNIGRGLNGYLLALNNYQITFFDVAPEIVDKLNNANSYEVIQKGKGSKIDRVTNFKALNIKTQATCCETEIINSEIITISIGINNLPSLVPLFINAFTKHAQKKQPNHINIIAVENGINATDILEKAVLEKLEDHNPQLVKHITNYFSFVNCAVDRIVPNQSSTSLNVEVEPFFELVCDQKKWHGPHLKGIKYSSFLDQFIQRKLFMLNATHAFIAWYGIKNHFTYIHEFKKNPKLVKKVNKLLACFCDILSKKFTFTAAELNAYAQKIITRLENDAIKDEVVRVGRGVKRKVASYDRFMTPIKYACDLNINPNEIINALAYAFLGLNFEDEEVCEINNCIKKHSLQQAIQKYTGANQEITSRIMTAVAKILN